MDVLAETGGIEPHSHERTSFQDGPITITGQSPMAGSGAVEAHTVRCPSASNGARRLAGSLPSGGAPRSRPPAREGRSAFKAVPAPCRLTLRGGERSTRSPHRESASRFRGGAGTPVRFTLHEIALSDSPAVRCAELGLLRELGGSAGGRTPDARRRRMYSALDGPSSTTPLELHLGVEPSYSALQADARPSGSCSMVRHR
mgnify:FL=1